MNSHCPSLQSNPALDLVVRIFSWARESPGGRRVIGGQGIEPLTRRRPQWAGRVSPSSRGNTTFPVGVKGKSREIKYRPRRRVRETADATHHAVRHGSGLRGHRECLDRADDGRDAVCDTVITSSPGPMSQTRRARCNASVPLPTPMANLTPMYAANSASKARASSSRKYRPRFKTL